MRTKKNTATTKANAPVTPSTTITIKAIDPANMPSTVDNEPSKAQESAAPTDALDSATKTASARVKDTADTSNTTDIPFSRLTKAGRYITLLEMYDGDYPKGSKMNEFLACLKPLVFELQLYENVKDNKELRDTVSLPCGVKGFKALQASIEYLEGRVCEMYATIFNDVFPDEAVAGNNAPETV